jgi:hypothetical protein
MSLQDVLNMALGLLALAAACAVGGGVAFTMAWLSPKA